MLGGVISIPGAPILLEGTDDPLLTRALIEMGGWLKTMGTPFPEKTWAILSETILGEKERGEFVTEKVKQRVPENLKNPNPTRSWVSGGWTSPSGVLPVTPEKEKELICTLIHELNGLFNLGLCPEPVHDRIVSSCSTSCVSRFLVIGGSHAIKEAYGLADRGHEVITCAVPGWRPNKGQAAAMAEKVGEALSSLTQSDVVVVHCFDNVAFMARSEEGGDLPIRKFISGDYHVEGELVLASQDRMHNFTCTSRIAFRFFISW